MKWVFSSNLITISFVRPVPPHLRSMTMAGQSSFVDFVHQVGDPFWTLTPAVLPYRSNPRRRTDGRRGLQVRIQVRTKVSSEAREMINICSIECILCQNARKYF